MQKKVITVGLVTLLALVFTACTDELGDRYVGFAQCLTQKKVRMYGAYWCPHCASQKKLFGQDAVEKLIYVECDPRGPNANKELCDIKGIKSYPTWEMEDGSKIEGEVSLEELSKKTLCELPKTQ